MNLIQMDVWIALNTFICVYVYETEERPIEKETATIFFLLTVAQL